MCFKKELQLLKKGLKTKILRLFHRQPCMALVATCCCQSFHPISECIFSTWMFTSLTSKGVSERNTALSVEKTIAVFLSQFTCFMPKMQKQVPDLTHSMFNLEMVSGPSSSKIVLFALRPWNDKVSFQVFHILKDYWEKLLLSITTSPTHIGYYLSILPSNSTTAFYFGM